MNNLEGGYCLVITMIIIWLLAVSLLIALHMQGHP